MRVCPKASCSNPWLPNDYSFCDRCGAETVAAPACLCGKAYCPRFGGSFCRTCGKPLAVVKPEGNGFQNASISRLETKHQ